MTEQPSEEWWLPRQLALVEDRSRVWRFAVFEPSAAVEMVVEGTRVTRRINAGEIASPRLEAEWDHEHCELFWRRIFADPADDHSGFTDGDKWLCAGCFQRYIRPRLAPV